MFDTNDQGGNNLQGHISLFEYAYDILTMQTNICARKDEPMVP